MDKALSRQIGATVLHSGHTLFILGISQPSLTYKMAIRKQVPLAAGPV
jgi:hypothetical protein